METDLDKLYIARNIEGLFDEDIARLVLKPHPRCVQGLCRRPNCRRKECRDAYHNEQLDRLNRGVEELLKREEPVWFVTLQPENASQPTETEQEIKDFKIQISGFWEALAKTAKRKGVALRYAYVVSAKTKQATSAFQLHIHAIVNWVPDPQWKPTKKRRHRYISENLEEKAASLGLKIQLEQAESAYGVARYLRNNLLKLNEAEMKSDIMLPRGFRRVSFSRSWAKLAHQKKRQAKMRDLQEADDDNAQPEAIAATAESEIQNNVLLPAPFILIINNSAVHPIFHNRQGILVCQNPCHSTPVYAGILDPD